MSALVSRFDVASIGKTTKTPQGFLRVPARLTRVGVLSYTRADGTTVRELRHPDEVFRADSLASLAGAPVTELHPSEMVSPRNSKALSVGHVGEAVRRDGKFVAAYLTISDEATIAKVEAGTLREISCGYKCRIDATPGVYEGEAYDQAQLDVVYNHSALGPRNWGRAGSDVALRLDSGDAMHAFADAHEARLDDANEHASGDEIMDLVTIKLDGIDVQVPKQSAQLIALAVEKRDGQITTLTAARDAQQGRADSATAALEAAKTDLAKANDPKRLDSAVADRVALVSAASKVLPADHKYDGQTARQIQEAVVLKLDAKAALEGKSDDYVAARFDAAVATVPQRSERSPLDRARLDMSDARNTEDRSRLDAIQHVPDWMKPTSVAAR